VQPRIARTKVQALAVDTDPALAHARGSARDRLASRIPFIVAVEVPEPTIDDIFAALQPTPEPTPGPALRTQEQQPVADANGGGGVDAAAAAAEPPVLKAPLIVAPLPISIPPIAAPVAPIGASAGGGPTPAVAVDTATVDARAP
jgi:hypothetical protein